MNYESNSGVSGRTVAAGALGVLVAAAIGAGIGVLFAPKAGEETREDLRKKAKQLASRFRKTRKQVQESVSKAFGKVTDELEADYLQIKGEIMSRWDALEPAKMTKDAYNTIVSTAVSTIAKAKKWTTEEIEKLSQDLQGEFEETKQEVKEAQEEAKKEEKATAKK